VSAVGAFCRALPIAVSPLVLGSALFIVLRPWVESGAVVVLPFNRLWVKRV